MQGNKLFFQNKRDLNISFNEKGMTNNALIEGDNFYALSKMKEMGKKFEVIYIDPPYNTGNDDLGYEDKRIGSEDGFKHSKWLAFMEPRLKLAQQLLTDDGVIFVSIDDHEQAYLKVMMDKIFGEQNFISNFIWKKAAGGKQDALVGNITEYILCFSKNINQVKIKGNTKDISFYNLEDEYVDRRGKYRLMQLDRGSLTYQKSLDYIIKHKGKIYIPHDVTIAEQKLRLDNNLDRKDWRWRWSKNKLNWGIENGFIVFKGNKVYTKEYINVNNNDELVNKTTRPYNIIGFDESISSRLGNDNIKNVLGEQSGFLYPKPLKLIKIFLNMIDNRDAHVLDFFAGSGTTGQAVLELNQEDGGHRQFTLVTSKEREDNIARTITYKRLSKVINGYTTLKGKEVAGIHANLSYYLGDIDQLVLEDEVDFGMVDDAVINEDKASTYAIKENAVLVKQFNASTFLFKDKDKKYTLIGEGLQDNLELEKYLEIDDELVIYDLGLDSQLIHQIEDNFKVKSVINLEDSRLPKYLDIEL